MTQPISVQLDTEQLSRLAQDAILQSITGEKRDALIRQAIAHLLQPTTDRWSSETRSPLQKAFEEAAYNAARQCVAKEFEKPETLAQMQELVAKAINKALSEGDAVSNMSAALVKALRPGSS